MFALSAADNVAAETALFYGDYPLGSIDSGLHTGPPWTGPLPAFESGALGSRWLRTKFRPGCWAAVPRFGQQMAVWLHVRAVCAAISSHRYPGKFLRCRLDASVSGMGSPDLSEQRCIFCAAHAGIQASLGNKEAKGVRLTCTLRSPSPTSRGPSAAGLQFQAQGLSPCLAPDKPRGSAALGEPG